MSHRELGAGGLALLSVALVPALAAPAADTGHANGPTTHALHMKCGPRPEGTTALIAIDGVIQDAVPEGDPLVDPSSEADRPLYGGLEPEDIFWIQTVCMHRQDSTFHLGGNGIPVASIWTAWSPAGQMPPVLAEIAEAEERHFERHDAYIGDLAEIDGFRSPDRVEIELEIDSASWIATARTDRFLGQCVAAGGAASPTGSEPVCQEDRQR